MKKPDLAGLRFGNPTAPRLAVNARERTEENLRDDFLCTFAAAQIQKSGG